MLLIMRVLQLDTSCAAFYNYQIKVNFNNFTRILENYGNH